MFQRLGGKYPPARLHPITGIDTNTKETLLRHFRLVISSEKNTQTSQIDLVPLHLLFLCCERGLAVLSGVLSLLFRLSA